MIHDACQWNPPPQLRDTLAQVDELQQRLNEEIAARTRENPDATTITLDSYHRDLFVRFAGHSAAIEGSTLSLMDTTLVLEGEFVPSDQKEVSDMFAVRGVAEGYQWAREQVSAGRDIDAGFIQDIHEHTALDLQPASRGRIRTMAVMIAGSGVSVSPPEDVRADLDYLLTESARSSQHPLVQVCAFHTCFERIHPFADGNGRVGRTVLNLQLAQAGYSPVAVKNDDRRAYLSALNSWQVGNDPQPLVHLVSSSVTAECQRQRELLALNG